MEGKTVIITGGSSGIGKSTALEFAQKGAQVLITGRREEALKSVASLHENISILVADSGDPSSAELIMDTAIAKWGKLDVLVNNAGAGATALLEDVTLEQINNVLSVNVVGSSLLAAASIPHLKKTKGTIINVSSVIGQMPAKMIGHYGASKAALDYLTKSWALELAPEIRVNAIAPGPTYSGALTGMMGLTEEQAAQVEEQETAGTPLQRRGVPEDISHWIVQLAEPTASWVTGQVISVDGGFAL
ncbi:SDR family NAD(P)-dependent oxidoreductase [Sansalvadorimonas verongulae]|uniref:SDR family NAD(P)-dependent oxidoreductase n=1 Tax=Sansalvadorimonas verongulae TaxID=2172824 RepID=UPI0012BB7C21|nr:SDR family oxidoreductase [Sansalvadorimonas verongulae]MTI12080.1 SDR family oxidoreductase [Sansalvadorimonas verongulae]